MVAALLGAVNVALCSTHPADHVTVAGNVATMVGVEVAVAPSPNWNPPATYPNGALGACTYAEIVYCWPGVSVEPISWCMSSKSQPPAQRLPLWAVTPVKTPAKVGSRPLLPVSSHVSKE